jgi:hypothetical protein
MKKLKERTTHHMGCVCVLRKQLLNSAEPSSRRQLALHACVHVC